MEPVPASGIISNLAFIRQLMNEFRKRRPNAWLLICFTLFLVCTSAQQPAPQVSNPDWVKDYPPFRIVGNLYYVGTKDLASYLLTTSEGHILINTGLASSVPMIRSHVEQLGFKFSDIRILLATHAHFDHVGGMAELKKLTHAKMMASEKDAVLLEDGGKSDYIFHGKVNQFTPVKVDRRLQDKDSVQLGGTKIWLLLHPGHTKGASSFLFDVKDERRSYRVFIASMPTILDGTKLAGMKDYPGVGKDFAFTLHDLKEQHFDIWLSAHAGRFNLDKKHQPGDAYNPAAFIDRAGYDSALHELQEDYTKRLKAEH